MKLHLACKLVWLTLLLKGCTLSDSASSAGLSDWSKALSTLNQPLAQDLVAKDGIFYSHRLEDDLFTINAAEIQSIKLLWQPQEKKLKDQGFDKKTIRSSKLPFFHERIKGLNNTSVTTLSPDSQPGVITETQAAAILNEVRQHHVASLEQLSLYARADEIGFCFGRALLVHYFLLRAGVPQHHMAKIFSIGQLKVGNTFWRFHVAVLLRTASGYVIMDPLHPKPMPVPEWLRINESYDVKAPWSEVRFYVTDPRKFMPATGLYEERGMQDPVYQNYFQQLIASLFTKAK